MDPFTLEKIEFDQVRHILARYCRCGLGHALAVRITPSRRPEMVRRWLAETAEMVAALIDLGTPPLGGVTDINVALDRAKPGGGAGGEDFAAIAETLAGAAAVKTWLAVLPEEKVLLRGLAEGMGNFDGEIRAIQIVVDERGWVRDSASTRLASIRRDIDACQQQIRQLVYSFGRRGEVAQYLQSTTVQMHEDRFVLPVKAEYRGRLPGVVHRASQSGATLFIEPAECVELNNRMARLHEKQHEEVVRLLSQLALRVHSREPEIRRSCRVLAQVDLLAAKAQYAHEFEMTCPEVTERGKLELFSARHPLLIEQAYQQARADVPAEERHSAVPIDVRLGADFDLLIITGSNTGGKTVALKTIGLLAMMAQSGLHVPAQRGATLPVFREVLLDMGDEQSLEQSLSTFGGHLRRIKRILRRADRYSLVLLDELGSGTDPEEGGAIGQAILDELRQIGCLGMVTTHLGTLKAYAYNHDRVDNASVEFDTRTLRPKYRLLIGQPGESHAIVIARHYGLPKRLISAARRHLGQHGKQLRQAIRATLASREASETARAEAQNAKVRAQTQQQQYEGELSDLRSVSERFNDWINSLPAMSPGDEVFVRRLNKTGTLERLQLSKQVAVVNVDKMQVEVPLQELMPDLGDPSAAGKVISLRRQIAQQAEQTAAALAEAERAKTEYHRSAAALASRRRQFDAWLAAVGKLELGREVSFAHDGKTGRGIVAALDLPAGRVSVETHDGTVEARVQDLFPDIKGFGGHPGRKHRSHSRRSPHGHGHGKTVAENPQADKADKPVTHRNPKTHRARASRAALLALPANSEVYVVPFRKRATLLRVDEHKNVGTVQSGAFELEVPLADLEPVKRD